MNDKGTFQQKYHVTLDSYIAVAITLLVFFSLCTVASFLFFNLSRSLTDEFEQRVNAESREIGQAINNRVNQLDSQINMIAHDNSVRVTLMLGAHKQLEDFLAKAFTLDIDTDYYINDLKRGKWFSTTNSQISLADLPRSFHHHFGSPTLTHTPDFKFSLTCTHYIERQKENIGTVTGVYRFKDDQDLQEIIAEKNNSRLFLLKEGQVWDLITGITIKDQNLVNALSNTSTTLQYISYQKERFAVVPQGQFENLYYFAYTNKLSKEKSDILFSVMLPVIGIMIITIFFSIILSRKVARPLQELSNFASKITPGDKSLPEHLQSSSIIEINLLQKSLGSMIGHLHRAREQERYKELFDGVADIVLIHTVEGKMLEINTVAEKLLSIDTQRLKDLNILNLVSDATKNSVAENLATLQLQQEQTKFVAEFTDRSGNLLIADCHARKIRFQNREVILNVARDISQKRKAENALKESHQVLHTILDSIQATIYVTDISDHTILFMNKYMIEEFGGEFVGKQCFKVFRNLDHPCGLCVAPKLVKEEDKFTKVITWEAQNPITKKWYLNYDRLIPWLDGRLVKFQIAFDISELKDLEVKRVQTEAELRHMQKMQAIGTLAGGVAHDLNNILSGMVSYPELLLMDLEENSPIRPHLMAIKDTGVKAAAIVQDLLTLARRGVVSNQVINLNEIISGYFTSPEMTHLKEQHADVEFSTELDADLFNILGSPIHLEKTLMNLISNSADAIEGPGKVFLKTSNEIISDAPDKKEGEYVVLQVTDNGSGISAESKERIFEPFFSTKVMGRSGTGLGMAVIWGTVEDHEGYIDLDSTVGKGTTFTLYFPVTRQTLVKEQLSDKPLNLDGRGESILIIDDVNEQRMIASMILTQLGYNTRTVASGEEAVNYLKEHEIDLLLLDMIMEGGMSGLETYREIIKTHPKQKAIISTGYSDNENVQEALRLGAGCYLKKPYLLKDIANAVRQELDK